MRYLSEMSSRVLFSRTLVTMNTRTRSAIYRQILARNLCTDQLSVHHDEKQREFYVKIGIDKAVLNYSIVKPKLVDMYHTEVPSVFRGKGVAAILAKAAFDHVVEQDMKMKLSCTYLQKYLLENGSEEHKKRAV